MLFRQGRVSHLLVDGLHPVHQFRGRADQRPAVDADGGVRAERLDKRQGP